MPLSGQRSPCWLLCVRKAQIPLLLPVALYQGWPSLARLLIGHREAQQAATLSVRSSKVAARFPLCLVGKVVGWGDLMSSMLPYMQSSGTLQQHSSSQGIAIRCCLSEGIARSGLNQDTSIVSLCRQHAGTAVSASPAHRREVPCRQCSPEHGSPSAGCSQPLPGQADQLQASTRRCAV